MHGIGGFAFEGINHRHFLQNLVRIFGQVAVLEQIRNQRMQPVNGHELLGEIEGRAKVIDAGIGEFGLGNVVTGKVAAQ